MRTALKIKRKIKVNEKRKLDRKEVTIQFGFFPKFSQKGVSKMLRGISVALLFGSVLLPSFSFAGGWSGNGGGSSQYDLENPWFLGAEPIPFCILKSQGQVPTTAALNMMIRRSAEKWKAFFERYGMQEPFSKSSSYTFFDGLERSVALNFAPATDCQEVEKFCAPERTDSDACHQALQDRVLFLIGKPNSVVKKYLELNQNVQGAAIRTDYNHKTFRSGGIIWINELKINGWNQYSHMILHEMGHVLGMKHDSCWVMAKNVADLIFSWQGVGGLGEVESINWPYSYKAGDSLMLTDQRVDTGSGKPGFYPNRWYLQGLTEDFGFSDEQYFSLSASVIWATKQSIKLKIVFEEFPSGKKFELEGELQGKVHVYEPTLVPSLFTNWANREDLTKRHQHSLFFQEGWSSDNFQGVVKTGEHVVPLTLERNNGLTLSLFFNKVGRWVTLSTMQNNTRRQESLQAPRKFLQ